MHGSFLACWVCWQLIQGNGAAERGTGGEGNDRPGAGHSNCHESAEESGMLDHWLEPCERVLTRFMLHILFIYV